MKYPSGTVSAGTYYPFHSCPRTGAQGRIASDRGRLRVVMGWAWRPDPHHGNIDRLCCPSSRRHISCNFNSRQATRGATGTAYHDLWGAPCSRWLGLIPGGPDAPAQRHDHNLEPLTARLRACPSSFSCSFVLGLGLCCRMRRLMPQASPALGWSSRKGSANGHQHLMSPARGRRSLASSCLSADAFRLAQSVPGSWRTVPRCCHCLT